MEDDEYRQLREQHNQDGAIDELKRRSIEKGLTTHNLTDLRESLLRDQTIARMAASQGKGHVVQS